MSLDPTDILGSFFQLLSDTSSPSSSSPSLSNGQPPPFYLDPSTNLFQNIFGGPGGGGFFQQDFGDGGAHGDDYGSDVVKYGYIAFACLFLLVAVAVIVLCVLCCNLCCCESDEPRHRRHTSPPQQQQKITLVQYAPRLNLTNINLDRRSALPAPAVYVRPFLED